MDKYERRYKELQKLMLKPFGMSKLPKDYREKIYKGLYNISYSAFPNALTRKQLSNVLKYFKWNVPKQAKESIIFMDCLFLKFRRGNRRREGDTEYYLKKIGKQKISLPLVTFDEFGHVVVQEGNHRILAFLKSRVTKTEGYYPIIVKLRLTY